MAEIDGKQIKDGSITNSKLATPGGTSLTEIEINFGGIPTSYGTFTITDAGVNISSKILINQSAKAATGRSSDENEMDPLVLQAIASNGSFTLYAASQDGPVVSGYMVNYMVVN